MFSNPGLFPGDPLVPLSPACMVQAYDGLLFRIPHGHAFPEGNTESASLLHLLAEFSAQHLAGTCSSDLLLHNKPPETQQIRQQCLLFSPSCGKLWQSSARWLHVLGPSCDCSRQWLEPSLKLLPLTSLVALAGCPLGPQLVLLARTPNCVLSMCPVLPHSMVLGSQSKRAWQGLHCLLGLSFRNHTEACPPYFLEWGSLKGPSGFKRRCKPYFLIGSGKVKLWVWNKQYSNGQLWKI